MGGGGSGVAVAPMVTSDNDRRSRQPSMRFVKTKAQRGGGKLGREIPASSPPVRPRFNHQYTSDRLREGLEKPPSFFMASNIRKDRKSIFRELGLDTDAVDEQRHAAAAAPSSSPNSPTETDFPELAGVASTSTGRTSDGGPHDRGWVAGPLTRTPPRSPTGDKPWYEKLAGRRRPGLKTVAIMATVTRRLRSKARAPT